MKTQRTAQKVKHVVYSGSIALTLAVITGAAVFALPTPAWSQTGEWTVYNTTNSGLPFDGVASLAIDAQQNVWIGTGIVGVDSGGGLAKFDGENWTVYNTANSKLPHNVIRVLTLDSQGDLWIGTHGAGVAKFDGANWTSYRPGNWGGTENRIFALPIDSEGNLWIGTLGLVKYDGTNWTAYNTSNSGLPSNMTMCAIADSQDNIWIGSWDRGVTRFDGTNWTTYSTANSGLPNNSIWSLAIDTQGSLWIGTNGGGCAKFDGVNWTTYNTGNSGLPTNTVHRIAIDPHGHVWMGTSGGLARFDGEDWRVYKTSNSGLPDNRVFSTVFDAQGDIWIGTQSGGLAVFRPMPTVDFNGNGIVDINDLLRLIESWGQDDPAVDIGPTPFGDGTVNAADLEVFVGYWAQEVDDPTLKACWKLDETEGDVAYDSAAESDAVVMGDAQWQPEGGYVGGAIHLDGSDDYVSTPFVLNPADTVFSVFAWVKGGGSGQVIVSQRDGVDWLLTDTQGNLMTALKLGGRRSGDPLISETIITDGNWHRVGFTWDGSDRILYVDDAEVVRDTQSNLKGASEGLCIGASKNLEPDTFWSGLIDDIRVYSRVVKP
jgi:hypothetical protein